MKIVFEGERFVAVDKPAAVLTVPSRMGAADARACLGTLLEAQLGVRLWPVHRLDFEVSGLVLFAKDSDAHRAASGWFEGRDVQKTYVALTEGTPQLPRGEPVVWKSKLLRGKKRAYESPHGKLAVTEATYVGNASGYASWRLRPETGRPHQLRVHLAKAGCPIAGDVLYGAQRPWPHQGIALRAVALDFLARDQAKALGLPEGLKVPEGFDTP